MQDPNPEVAGRGLLRLMQAGIAVQSGVLEAEARGSTWFIKRMEHGLPFVQVKLAMSLDGRTAMASGKASGSPAPPRVRRCSACALAPAWCCPAPIRCWRTMRGSTYAPTSWAGLRACARRDLRQPLRVLVDGRLRGCRWNRRSTRRSGTGGDLRPAPSARERFQDAGHELLALPSRRGACRPAQLLVELAARGANEVLVEAGPRLAGAFARLGLVDEYRLFVAPKFLGSSARSFARLAAGADGPMRRSCRIDDIRRQWATTGWSPRGPLSAGRLNFAARRRGGRCTSGATVVKRHTAISVAVTFSGRGESPHRR